MKRLGTAVDDLLKALSLAVFSALAFLIGVMAITYQPAQLSSESRSAGPDYASRSSRSNGVSPSARPNGVSYSTRSNDVPHSVQANRVEPGLTKVQPESTTANPQPAVNSSTLTVASRGIPVLCYHYLRESTTPLQFAKILGALLLNLPLLDDMDLWTQTASAFEKQMAFLKDEGYQSIDLEDLDLWRRGLATLPPKPVVITFDDGDRSALDIALPILERYGFKATLFVVTSKVGQKWDRVDCLNWDELKALETSGVFSIQSHSHDLHRKVHTEENGLPVFMGAGNDGRSDRLANDEITRVYEDLLTSKAVLETHLGRDTEYLAWPYGFADAVLDSVAAEAGFDGLCTLRAGRNKRFAIAHADGGTALWLTDLGALAPRPVFAFNWSTVPASAPAHPLGVNDWGSLEIKRFTITARTSIRTFKKMLEE